MSEKELKLKIQALESLDKDKFNRFLEYINRLWNEKKVFLLIIDNFIRMDMDYLWEKQQKIIDN